MWVEYLIVSVLGLCIGSFVNVLVLRHGYRERPNNRSACAACHHQLGALDLLPVFSFIALCGRCRHCGSAISWQYVFVELTVALLFALTYFVLQPVTPLQWVNVAAYGGAWAALVAIVAYDIRHTLVPMPFVYALYVAALIHLAAEYALYADLFLPFDAVLGVVALGGFFALVSLATRGRGMGMGDAYIAAGIGGMLGFTFALPAAALAVWSGAVYGLLVIALQRCYPHAVGLTASRRATLKAELPFAPFLLLGAVAAFATALTYQQLAGWFIII